VPNESDSITYADPVQGVRSASFSVANSVVSGSVDGRAIVPTTITSGFSASMFLYADGLPAPTPTLDPLTAAAFNVLLAKVPSTSIPSTSTPAPSLIAADPVEGDGIPSSVGPGGSDQNNALYYATHDCQSCAQGCASNVWSWVVPGGVLVCLGNCFIPGNGCAEQICGGFRIAACDRDQACCGTTCCGQGYVCGDNNLGYCCPGDHPVACGDETAALCFLPGSTCCGGIFACNAGETCQNNATPNDVPTCCPNDNVCDGDCCTGRQTCQAGPSGGKVCCDHPLCGDSCCAAGEVCNNGVCGFGQQCGSSVCGITQNCCGGSCCDGNCVGGNTCCPSSQAVCGSACCAAGQVCLDATRSLCGVAQAPVLQLYDTATGALLGQSGGPPVRITNNMNVIVKGSSWSTGGSVTLTVDSANGAKLGNAAVDGLGTFSTTISTGAFPGGTHNLVGTEGNLSTSVSVIVTPVG
jgi:hypothetical protein